MLHKLSVAKPTNTTSEVNVKKLADKIIFSKKYSRKDHSLLTAIILGDSDTSDNVRRQVNRVLDQILEGELKLVDW
ncbi:MAG: hypothetical protein IGS39_02715 [Calothrix sp. C42_A2020_038]|nr:hypothetical protein [Calothrix sp. C42_A2020_038]